MKLYTIWLFITLSSTPCAYCINASNETTVRTSIDAMKEYALSELSKALIFTNQAQRTKNRATQQKFKGKVEKAIDGLQETTQYLKPLKKAVRKVRPSRAYLEKEINDAINMVKGYRKMATQELLSIKILPSFTVIDEPTEAVHHYESDNRYETNY